MTTHYRIHVSSLSDRNAGVYIEITPETTVKEIRDSIKAMLKRSAIQPADEYIVDYAEGFPFDVPEFGVSFIALINASSVLDELSDDEQEAFEEYLSYYCDVMERFSTEDSAEELIETFRDRFVGQFDSVREFGDYLVEESGYFDGVPDHIRCYIDETHFANDLLVNGDYYMTDSGYVFHGF